jgi:hypothetical protein
MQARPHEPYTSGFLTTDRLFEDPLRKPSSKERHFFIALCFIGVELLAHDWSFRLLDFQSDFVTGNIGSEALTGAVSAVFSIVFTQDMIQDSCTQKAVKLIAAAAIGLAFAYLTDPTGLSVLNYLFHHALHSEGIVASMASWCIPSMTTDLASRLFRRVTEEEADRSPKFTPPSSSPSSPELR